MTDINKLAERLRELSQAAANGRWSEFSVLCGNADHVLQTAASELRRLDSALREHMQLTRDAVEQCDVLRAQLREIESAPAPVPEPAGDYATLLQQFRGLVNVSRFLSMAASGAREGATTPPNWRAVACAPTGPRW